MSEAPKPQDNVAINQIQKTPAKDVSDEAAKMERAKKRLEQKMQGKEIKRPKKPFWKKAKEALFVESAGNVGVYLWREVLLPAIKKLMADTAKNAVDMAVYGDAGGNRNRSHTSNSSLYSGRAQANGVNYNRGSRYSNFLSNMEPRGRAELEDNSA